MGFLSLKYFTSIPMRHGTIMPNANIQNMPPSSPTSMELLNINFATKRTISKPNRMNKKALDFLTYKLSSFFSKFVVLINTIENSIPTKSDSTTWGNGTLNSSNKNISAPVDMNSGGKMIFFGEIGLFAAFVLTMNASVPMNKNNTVEPIIK